LSKSSQKKTPPFVRGRVLSLAEKNGWRASEGHKLMVVGGGDLRFEYPSDFIHEFSDQSVKVRDKVFPKDVMVLEVSVVKTPPITSWENVPTLFAILTDNLLKQGRSVDSDAIHVSEAPNLEIAWAEYESDEEDPQTHEPRPAVWRQAHCFPGKAHKGKYMPFGIISFGFWKDHAEKANPVWDHFLSTVIMGNQPTDSTAAPIQE